MTIGRDANVYIGYEEKQTHITSSLFVNVFGKCQVAPLVFLTRETHLQGGFVGSETVVVKSELNLYFSGYSNCRNCSAGSTEFGEYWFGSLNIRRTGRVNIISREVKDVESPYTIQFHLSEELDMDYGSNFVFQHGFVVLAKVINMDRSIRMSVTGLGYGSDSGPGKGDKNGAGGSYGGRGGRNDFKISDLIKTRYGHRCQPTDSGSGGAGCRRNRDGGTGGGTIKFVAEMLLIMEGRVEADGVEGDDGTGGGSGGLSGLKGAP